MSRRVLIALLSGLIINLFDVTITVATVAAPWNAVLASQGLTPSAATPPYYVSASFVAGALLVWLYLQLARARGGGARTALLASAVLWGISRLYGAGHVVMGQMPAWIFAVMSSGLLLGFVVAGQVAARLLDGRAGVTPRPLAPKLA